MSILYISNEADFTSLLASNPFVVVDFYSTECPPCEKLAPIYERLASHYTMFTFVKIWRQQFRALAESLDVHGSPTVLLFSHGTLQEKRFSGDIEEIALKQALDDILRAENITRVENTAPTSTETRDLCIIGTGPAGLTASVYAARYKVDHTVVGELTGGLMTSSHKICNYPSENEISGIELTEKMVNHVKHLDVPIHEAAVVSITKRRSGYDVLLSTHHLIRAKTILLTTGTKHKTLGLEEEHALVGRGVSYCATCDAAFYAGKTVAVIGGSDSANTASLYLASIAKHVYQIYRGKALRGETAWIDQINAHPNITVLYETNVTHIDGTAKVTGVQLDKPFNGSDALTLDGVFIEIGSDPDGRLIEQLGLGTDEKGYIKTRPDQRTNKKGVWAAGDITTNSNQFRQIVTACSEGAIAAQSIFMHVQKDKSSQRAVATK